MNSFSAEIGNRGYHVYKDISWKSIYANQLVAVQKETDNKSLQIDPYCCRITIRRAHKIGPVTVRHIPREISRFVYFFLHEGGAVSGTVVDTIFCVSPIPEGGLEIKLLLYFTHPVDRILEKMKELTNKQLARLEETLNFTESYNGNDDDEDNEIVNDVNIIVESDKEEDECLVEENGSIEPENNDVSKKNIENIEKEIFVIVD